MGQNQRESTGYHLFSCADNFILHEDEHGMMLQVFRDRAVVLGLAGGKVSLSSGDTSLQTPQRTKNKALFFFQVSSKWEESFASIRSSLSLPPLPSTPLRALMARNTTWEPIPFLIPGMQQRRSRLGMGQQGRLEGLTWEQSECSD